MQFLLSIFMASMLQTLSKKLIALRRGKNAYIFFGIKFVLLFTGFSIAYIYSIKNYSTLFSHHRDLIATSVSFLLNILGEEARVVGSTTIYHNININVINACNGITATVILLSALLAFPTSPKDKAIGVILGITAIQLINIVRIVIVTYALSVSQDYFLFMDVYVGQIFLIIFATTFWVFWIRR